jgi:glycosyltransferase involved in cell wall biosynthesis
MYKGLKIALGIPVFNELGKLDSLVQRIEAVSFLDEVVFVDDCSTDGSYEHLVEKGLFKIIRHDQRSGVGAAIRTFYGSLLDSSIDVAVLIAGNDKDRPEEIPRLLDPIIDKGYDLVQGSRYLPGGAYGNMPFKRILATRCIHPMLFRLATGKKMTDTTNGFRSIRMSLIRALWPDLQQQWLNTYDLEPYILYRSLQEFRVTEAPVIKIYPDYSLGYSKLSFKHWWSIVRPIFLLKLGLRR